MMQQEEIRKLEALFNNSELSRLSARTSKRTFMEILGVGRTEAVVSQALSFFLDAKAEHGFYTLWIESLLKAASRADKSFDPEFYDLCVERSDTEEVTTIGVDQNLRIDVIVETGDLVLGIENKIGASVYNDLGAYAAYLHAKASGEGKQPLLILLTREEEPTALERWAGVCEEQGVPLCNVTYAGLFEQVELGVGPAYLKADPDWLCYMKDFIRTLKGLEDKMPEVDEELFAFVSKHRDEFVLVRERYNEVYNAQVEQGRRLLELIRQDEDIKRLGFGEPRIHKDKSSLWMSVYFNVSLKGVKGNVHPEIGNSVHNTSIRAWTGGSDSAKSSVISALEQRGKEPDKVWEKSLDVETFPVTTPDDVLVEKFKEFLTIIEPYIVKK